MPNPSHSREQIAPFLGRKVVIGTADYHYVSGRVVEFVGELKLRITVNGKPLVLDVVDVATISEVPDVQAEYVK
jgi:hypothetical protein